MANVVTSVVKVSFTLIKILLFSKEKENWALFFLLLAVLSGSQLQLKVGFTSCGL